MMDAVFWFVNVHVTVSPASNVMEDGASPLSHVADSSDQPDSADSATENGPSSGSRGPELLGVPASVSVKPSESYEAVKSNTVGSPLGSVTLSTTIVPVVTAGLQFGAKGPKVTLL